MDLHAKSFLYGAIAGSSIYAFLRWIHDNRKNKKAVEEEVDILDYMFFVPKLPWNNCFASETQCGQESCSTCSYNKLRVLISSAKTHLDICVYLITYRELIDLIITLFKDGVFVRIITDKQVSEEAIGAGVVDLMREHIPVKVIKTEMMHNKFAVIDKKIVITGSFNWTKQGFNDNFENGVVIRNKAIVEKYIEYFRECWLGN